MEKMENKAVMLTFLSPYRGADEESYCYVETKEYYQGKETNEAPSKCLLEQALKKGIRIEQIFVLVSQMTFFQKEKEETTAFQAYQEMIKDYCEDKTEKSPEIIPIYYDFEMDENHEPKPVEDKEEQARRVFRQIADKLDFSQKNQSVYVEYTGGLRDISFLMVSIIRYLEFVGIRCEQIVYSQQAPLISRKPLKREGENQIFDLRYIYDIYQLINGVNKFVTTGNADQLQEFFSVHQKETKVQDVLSSMIEFSDAIGICDIWNINETLKKMITGIKTLQQDQNTYDIYTEMFKQLIPTIKEKFKLIGKNLDSEQIEISFLDIIEWCVENGLLQQAVTIIEVALPQWYVENHIFYYEKSEEKKLEDMYNQDRYSNHAEMPNYFFYAYLRNSSIIRGKEYKEVQGVSEKLKELEQMYLKDTSFMEGLNWRPWSVEKTIGQSWVKCQIYTKDGPQRFDQLKVINRLKPNEFTILYTFHIYLKEQRNRLNHASKAENRLDYAKLKEGIGKYIAYLREVEKQ